MIGWHSDPGAGGRRFSDEEMLAATDTANIAACRYCDDHGWLEEIATSRLYRCSHIRAVTGLTLTDVLGEIPGEDA